MEITSDYFIKLMKTAEKLHPDLKAHLEETEDLGTWLKHPLVIGMYSQQQNAVFNAQYKHKKKVLHKAQSNKDWDSWIWIHERPFRLEAFLKIQKLMSCKHYWELLREVWTDSENPSVNTDIWLMLFENLRWSKSSRTRYIMSKSEKESLHSLPNPFKIYRGYINDSTGDLCGEDGLSWTVSYEKAKWFACRWKRKEDMSVVAHAECHHKDVIAYCKSRGEAEIVIDPSNLNGIISKEVAPEEERVGSREQFLADYMTLLR